MSHPTERFADAVRALISDGPIKQRLSRAYAEHLADLQAADVPAALRGAFSDLQTALTRIAPVGNESRIRANVQKMSPDEACSHAATIVKMYVELMAQGERSEPLKVVSSGKNPPRYLTNRP